MIQPGTLAYFNKVNDFRSHALLLKHIAPEEFSCHVAKACHQARGRTTADDGPRASMDKWLLANAMVYGLINVRTDGHKIVMGVLKESEASFQIEEFTP